MHLVRIYSILDRRYLGYINIIWNFKNQVQIQNVFFNTSSFNTCVLESFYPISIIMIIKFESETSGTLCYLCLWFELIWWHILLDSCWGNGQALISMPFFITKRLKDDNRQLFFLLYGKKSLLVLHYLRTPSTHTN